AGADGGAASPAADGGSGGAGGKGGDANGGAIYNAGTLNLDDASLQFDEAQSRGGGGGSTSYIGTPGTGASSGAAEGGALYTVKPLEDACVTFGSDKVSTKGGPGGKNYSAGTQAEAGRPGPALGPDVEGAGGASVGPCQRQLSVSDAFVQEPPKGSAEASFTVSINETPKHKVTVEYATKDGTATVGHGDYKAESGTLTFQPGGATEQTVSVPVYDSGLTAEARFSLVLSKPDGAALDKAIGICTIESGLLKIVTDHLPDGEPGDGYSEVVEATGGVPTYTWSVVGGALPSGLYLDPVGGGLRGTPTKQGIFTFRLEVTDAAEPPDQAQAKLSIAIGLGITSLSPSDGPEGGGGTITVSGYGFQAATDKLAFCPSGSSSGCTAASDIDVVSDTSLTATIPPESDPVKSAGGRASVAVDQGTRHSNLVAFTYGLDIMMLSPAGSDAAGGGDITVTGVGFEAAPDILAFCPAGKTSSCVAASDLVVDSDTQLTATIPAESSAIKAANGAAGVAVDQGGSNYSNFVGFNYGIHVDSISPDISPAAGGATITVTGYGFEGAADTLAFCPAGKTSSCVAASDLVVDSDTELTATIPAESSAIKAANGEAGVAVDQGGTNHSNLVSFTYRNGRPA
ncbi:MAG TPA: IPT/TIG domain-containing protein, partial [Acidimicrobiales bacterium]|nr:IPT/TIG domain-containing protein [Acidimicrobiales bacterium]